MATFYDQIVCFGDSITQQAWDPELAGWGAGLANVYQRRLDIIGRGFSGYTTVLLPQIIPETVPKGISKIKLLMLFFGANDSTIKGSPQHVPLETYAQNLRDILTHPVLKQHNPDVKLLLLTPPPICAWRWGDKDRQNGRNPQRTAEHTALYAAKAKSVAQELDIPSVDLWTGFLHAAGWKEGDPLLGSTHVPKSDRLGDLLADGLHFTAEGNRLCFQLVFAKIKEVYPELDPERMELITPLWNSDSDVLADLKDKIAKIRELN